VAIDQTGHPDTGEQALVADAIAPAGSIDAVVVITRALNGN
jgi:hypothetical protein